MSAQLDLFAESEAAEVAAREDSAPCLFDTDVKGFHSRVLAAQWWREKFGAFDWYRRSHAWHPCITAPTGNSGMCRPTLLMASLHCDHSTRRGLEPTCQCVGRSGVYRGACLCCVWEGTLRATENEAVEDAHDHAWPGWRDLPTVDRAPMRGTGKRESAKYAAWVAAVNAVYPAGWLESGGPIRTERLGGMRHVPLATGFGGYDLSSRLARAAS